MSLLLRAMGSSRPTRYSACSFSFLQGSFHEVPHHLNRFQILAPSFLYTLPDSDGQVFVFHFPGVIQRVIRGVPNQIAERPGSGHFALSMERPNGIAIGVTVRFQALVGQLRAVRSAQSQLRGHVLLRGQRMLDDVIPIQTVTKVLISMWALLDRKR